MKSGERHHAKFGDNIRAVIGVQPTGQLGADLPQPVVRSGDAPYLKHARLIPVDRLVPDPDQPRRDWSDEDSLQELGESIKSRGLLQPIRVRPVEDGNWMIITGERRWRAARLAGVPALPAIEVTGALDPNEIKMDQLVENALRLNLAPIEQANAFKALIDATGMSQRALAERLNISHVAVVQSLALLKLPPEVQEFVETGDLAPTTAYEVAKLESPAEQAVLAARAVNEELTRAEVIEKVREKKADKSTPSKRPQSIENKFKIVEIELDRSCKISIAGVPADAGPEAVLEILRRAVDKVKVEIASTL
jgi:ParB family transcriptional regulator, chromosome partitioning protein